MEGTLAIERQIELPSVLRELAARHSALGFVLSIYTREGLPSVMYLENDSSLPSGTLSRLVGERRISPSVNRTTSAQWLSIRGVVGCEHILAVPIHENNDGSSAVLSVVFDKISANSASEVENDFGLTRSVLKAFIEARQAEHALAQRHDLLETALNILGTGVLIINQAGDVAFKNDAAAAIINGGDGLCWRGASIAASSFEDDLRLQVAIDHVCAVEHQSNGEGRKALLLSLSRQGGAPLVISIVPAPQQTAETGPSGGVIYISDPDFDTSESIKMVCKLFRLTPVETRLASFIANGDTLSEAAEKMHIKDTTARSTLHGVFLKTRTGRQAQLVRFLLTHAMRIRPSHTIDSI